MQEGKCDRERLASLAPERQCDGMRICVVTHGVEGGNSVEGEQGSEVWGGKVLVRLWGQGLARRGHDVTVVSPSEEIDGVEKTDAAWGTIAELGVEPLWEGVNPMWSMHRRPSLYENARQLVQEYRPDAAIGHTLPKCVSVFEALSDADVPIVFNISDFSHLCDRNFLLDADGELCSGPESPEKCIRCIREKHPTWRQAGMRAAESSVGDALLGGLLGNRRAESFRLREGVEKAFEVRDQFQAWVNTWLAPSETVEHILERYGVPECDIARTGSYGLEDDRLKPTPSRTPLEDRPLRLGYFGRISREKGVFMLADVLGQVADGNLTWVVISYDVADETKAELRRRAGLQGNQIEFVERRSGAQLNEPVASLDVCVVPSQWPETGPFTVLEAMAQNVPCICNDLSANAQLIENGQNGMTFETGVEASLRRCVSEVLNQESIVEEWRAELPEIRTLDEYAEELSGYLKSAAEGQ